MSKDFRAEEHHRRMRLASTLPLEIAERAANLSNGQPCRNYRK